MKRKINNNSYVYKISKIIIKPQHQANKLFIKMWIKLELLDMLAKIETRKL